MSLGDANFMCISFGACVPSFGDDDNKAQIDFYCIQRVIFVSFCFWTTFFRLSPLDKSMWQMNEWIKLPVIANGFFPADNERKKEVTRNISFMANSATLLSSIENAKVFIKTLFFYIAKMRKTGRAHLKKAAHP